MKTEFGNVSPPNAQLTLETPNNQNFVFFSPIQVIGTIPTCWLLEISVWATNSQRLKWQFGQFLPLLCWCPLISVPFDQSTKQFCKTEKSLPLIKILLVSTIIIYWSLSVLEIGSAFLFLGIQGRRIYKHKGIEIVICHAHTFNMNSIFNDFFDHFSGPDQSLQSTKPITPTQLLLWTAELTELLLMSQSHWENWVCSHRQVIALKIYTKTSTTAFCHQILRLRSKWTHQELSYWEPTSSLKGSRNAHQILITIVTTTTAIKISHPF